MNITPHQDFLANPTAVKRHQDLTSQPHVKQSIETALLKMVLAAPTNDEGSSKSFLIHQRIEGAKEFIRTWLSLADPTPKPTSAKSQHLNPV